MSNEYSEDNLVEQATEDILKKLGWQVVRAWHKETFGEKGLLGREVKSEVILKRYLLVALIKFNPNKPQIAYEQAIELIQQKSSDKKLGRINKEKYDYFKKGVPVSYTDSSGKLKKERLQVFDFKEPLNNDFLAVRQLEVYGEIYNRRPDMICFVNGIPLVFIELKGINIDIRSAYDDNLTDYKDTIPELFYSNAFIILSNGAAAKVGTITGPYKFFLDWKRIEEDDEGEVELDTMLQGTCAHHRFMDIFENFLLFDTSAGEVSKIMAKNHQYIGVNKVIEQVNHIQDLEGKLGVFWHTQGSGKSYSMVFLCEKIHRKLGGAYTFLIVADRTELETQLYDTFSGVGVVDNKHLIAGKKKGMTGREHLRELLSENNRYVFTLVHKFSIDPKTEIEYPLITERKNVIVISDEAHRTQSGNFAQNMHFNALPNASFLGFTGTPIIQEEKEITKNIFGEYVSTYDFKRAIDDEATLPLRYINRGEKLDIKNPKLDEQMAEALENENLDDEQKKKLAYLFQKDYPILTATPRLDKIAKDLVWHFNERGYQGKGMFVALDKPTAVRIYDLIQFHWTIYLENLKKEIKKCKDSQLVSELERKYNRVEATEVCVIVSSEQNEVDKFRKLDLDIATHRKKIVARDLEKELKDAENPFRLAIVCAMWITGFDAKCVSTVYLDKPIKGHTLMQTIARANRVYDDEKENGLIVDYGNVYKQLEKAYSVYGEGTGGTTGGSGKPEKDLKGLAKELKKAIADVKKYLKDQGFKLQTLIDAEPLAKIAKIKEAENAICLNQTTRTNFEFMARHAFRKYKALFPEKEVKAYKKSYDAINSIYNYLNQKVKSADVTAVIKRLQDIVSESIIIENQINDKEAVYVDLSTLDFQQLKAAFAKTKRKNTVVFDLQQAIQQRLEQMLKENPLRLEFYERYQKIIKEYNQAKEAVDLKKTFDKLTALVEKLAF
jgi:type I restriction enzyme R subunit